MRILITAGPTHEPIDPVRYIGNRSSGKLGKSLAAAAVAGGHEVTLILGPVQLDVPSGARRIDIDTAADLHAVLLAEFPHHDLLIMAAAVADYRPKSVSIEKLDRSDALIIETEATPDVVADLSERKRRDQRTVAFSLEAAGNVERARQKMYRKRVDLMVFNAISTINADLIQATLLYPNGREEAMPALSKSQFAPLLIARAAALFMEGSTQPCENAPPEG